MDKLKWTPEKREEFARQIYNLIITHAVTDRTIGFGSKASGVVKGSDGKLWQEYEYTGELEIYIHLKAPEVEL